MEKPDHSLPMKQENVRSEDSKSKRLTIYNLVRQSFDIFNLYGKDPATIENIVLAFNLALERSSIESIQYAFKEWMKTSSVMPTPADIVKLSESCPKRQSDGQILWLQSIRDADTNAVLDELPHEDRLSQLEAEKKFTGHRIKLVAIRQ